MPSLISSRVSLFWSSLQIVDSDQVVLTSSTDYTVRLWSARGEFIGRFHFVSVNLIIPDIFNVYVINIDLEHDAMFKMKMLLFIVMFIWVLQYQWVYYVTSEPWDTMVPPSSHSMCSVCMCPVIFKYPSSTVRHANYMALWLCFAWRASKQPALLHEYYLAAGLACVHYDT